jgi:6-phosphogluconolactonase
MDPESGRLEPAGTSSEISNPSYITVSSDGKFLYATAETETYGGVNGGAVAAYMLEKHTGKLMFLNSVSTKGSMPCHLSTDKANKYLFAANYGEGSLTVFNLHSDGSVGSVASYIRHHGSGPVADRQEKPHVHFTGLTPDEKYLCAVDLGTDSIVAYGLDSGRPGGVLYEESSVPVKPGSGPRHLEFSSDGRFMWVINELSSDIVTYSCDTSKPSFREIQTISTIPEGYPEVNYCAAIHLSPDGNFLYASNRGHDSIARYTVDKSTGLLSKPDFTPSEGAWPRDFAIDKSGSFLYAANQVSGSVTAFKINADTGKPEYLGWKLEIPDPVCIKIVKLH